jgi:hypothetical protein
MQDFLDSWVWQEQDKKLATTNLNRNACLQQNTGELSADFFQGGWGRSPE